MSKLSWTLFLLISNSNYWFLLTYTKIQKFIGNSKNLQEIDVLDVASNVRDEDWRSPWWLSFELVQRKIWECWKSVLRKIRSEEGERGRIEDESEDVEETIED